VNDWGTTFRCLHIHDWGTTFRCLHSETTGLRVRIRVTPWGRAGPLRGVTLWWGAGPVLITSCWTTVDKHRAWYYHFWSIRQSQYQQASLESPLLLAFPAGNARERVPNLPIRILSGRLCLNDVVLSKLQVQFNMTLYPKPQVPQLPQVKTTRKMLGLKSRPGPGYTFDGKFVFLSCLSLLSCLLVAS